MYHMSIPSGLILNILNTLLFQSENELNGSKDRIRLVQYWQYYFLYFYCYLGFLSQAKQIIFCFHKIYLKLKCNCYHIFSGHKGAFNIHFLGGGGGREGGLRDLGGTTSFFRGVVVRISCVQQSTKWEL